MSRRTSTVLPSPAAPVRVSSGARKLRAPAANPRRRGQAIVLALGILFLLSVLGGIFITSLLRNLQRTSRTAATDDALSLALAGLQYAAQQFRTSDAGADWRPSTSEALWRTPLPPPGSVQIPGPTGPITLSYAELRKLDPDYDWLTMLNEDGTFRQIPYTRVSTGRGRFLLRVTYLPSFKSSSAAGEAAGRSQGLFDPASAMIHIESVGRPGEIDPNDPTFFTQDPTGDRVGNPIGQFRRVEAFVPVGLVDQLWWVTNRTGERGPAVLGVPPILNPGFDPSLPEGPNNRRYVEYTTVWEGGGIRSNTNVQWTGQNVIRIYPARAEGLYIKGKQSLAARGNPSSPTPKAQARVLASLDRGGPNSPPPYTPTPTILDDGHNDAPDDDVILAEVPILDSDDPGFDPQRDTIEMQTEGRDLRYGILTERTLRGSSQKFVSSAEATRFLGVPVLDQADATTGINRWVKLTRDSGGQIQVIDAGQSRLANAGEYGFTDRALPPSLRARGLYLDNYDDVQYREDRGRVKNEWLQRGSAEERRRSWVGDRYEPKVYRSDGPAHPVAEVFLTSRPDPANPGRRIPALLITRYDPDVRNKNLAPATGRRRQFYDFVVADPNTGRGTLQPIGFSRFFDYPENGVLYAEGSIRVRGVVGTSDVPRQLTIVSGGTIYLEGNVLKGHPASFVGLLAQDYVTLNPTVFTRLHPRGQDAPDADAYDTAGMPTSFHWEIDQGEDMDVSFSSAQALSSALMLVKHTAVLDDSTSETAVTLSLPRLSPGASQAGWPDWNADRYNFGASPLGSGGYSGAGQLFYLFHQFLPQPPLNWAESNFQTVAGTGDTANYERKAFLLPEIASDGGTLNPGEEATLRITVGPKDGAGGPEMSENGQPYWLSRIAFVPEEEPLQIRIEAVMLAYNGSWFVIPPPQFNDNPADTRARFLQTGARAAGTFPNDTDDYPFYNEPLNVSIQVVGAVSENMPAEGPDKAAWTERLWHFDEVYDPGEFPPMRPPRYRPDLRFRFDHSLRRWVRVRIAKTGQEILAWTAAAPIPGNPTPDLSDNVGLLSEVIAYALQPAVNSHIEFLPVLPKLPASTVVYEGNPLQ